MVDEATDPTELNEVQQRGTLSAVGAEAVDISSTDAEPSRNDPKGVALIPRALYIGGAGDVKVDLSDGTEGVTFKAAPVGVLPIQAVKVWKVGTGATDMLFLY
jgi:hypothetical protein